MRSLFSNPIHGSIISVKIGILSKSKKLRANNIPWLAIEGAFGDKVSGLKRWFLFNCFDPGRSETKLETGYLKDQKSFRYIFIFRA
jgi:hypothetical protein